MVFEGVEKNLVALGWPLDEGLMEGFVPISRSMDFAKRCWRELKASIKQFHSNYFQGGYFDWRKAKDEFFRVYFAYYQQDDIDLSKRPDLQGLMTEWMTAEELVKHMQLGDLIEFKGTASGLTLFHHWSICVRVNNEVESRKRTTRHVRMLHLSRVDHKHLTRGDIFNYGIIFVSAKVRLQYLHETHMERRCRINNSLDRVWEPFDKKDIARHALTWRGCARYNGTLWNCEHFVKCCRYGHGESVQTEMIATLVTAGLALAAFLSWIALPAWISVNLTLTFIFGYYYGLKLWRIAENAIFVYMREHDIPISLYSLWLVYEKMNAFEMYCLFCFYLFCIGLYCTWLFFILQLFDIELFVHFGTRA